MVCYFYQSFTHCCYDHAGCVMFGVWSHCAYWCLHAINQSINQAGLLHWTMSYTYNKLN